MMEAQMIEIPKLDVALRRVGGVARVTTHVQDTGKSRKRTLYTVTGFDGQPIAQNISDRDIILLALGMNLLGEVYDD